MRIIGIDYGSARIGVALGDTETNIATPWRVLLNEDEEDAMDQLVSLAKTEGAERFVIGIPHGLVEPSHESQQAREIRAFAKKFKERGFPVEEEDETWSTGLAKIQAEEMEQHRKRDDLAAAAILQSYLDRYALHP